MISFKFRTKHPVRPTPARAMIEDLEGRQLLAATLEGDGKWHLRANRDWQTLPTNLANTTQVVVEVTQLVESNYDARDYNFTPGTALQVADANDPEPQGALFDIRTTGTITVKNMKLNCRPRSGYLSDGIYVKGGNITIQNVRWDKVGEDALTVKPASSGFPQNNITISGGRAAGYTDKCFQINAPCNFTVTNGFNGTAGSSSAKGIRTEGSLTTLIANIKVTNATFTGGAYAVGTSSTNVKIDIRGGNFSGQSKGTIAVPNPSNTANYLIDPGDTIVKI